MCDSKKKQDNSKIFKDENDNVIKVDFSPEEENVLDVGEINFTFDEIVLEQNENLKDLPQEEIDRLADSLVNQLFGVPEDEQN
ncbi:MAG: hypothetical protein CMB22_01585 [Euryarchaeota archaeon]|jgi:hypothetical protein|nr:hypothetical protein [Euryarchaeota archaeon]|tara:strand:- start:4508 stop:4756 length:249 start_codon:yes stop_codon:yes gene_type:complete